MNRLIMLTNLPIRLLCITLLEKATHKCAKNSCKKVQTQQILTVKTRLLPIMRKKPDITKPLNIWISSWENKNKSWPHPNNLPNYLQAGINLNSPTKERRKIVTSQSQIYQEPPTRLCLWTRKVRQKTWLRSK